MINERSIINFFIILAGAILGPYVVISVLKSDLALPMTFVAMCFLAFVFFVIKDKIALLPLLSTYFSGQLNFLPGSLDLVNIFSVALILYYGIAYVAIRQRPIHLGLAPLTFPIFVLALIVLYHDRKFGLHTLNSTDEGSRPGVAIIVMVIAYFCGISVAKLPISFLRRFPWYCCAIAMISSIPFLITTYIPSLAPYVYVFTTNVNTEAYLRDIASSGSGGDDVVGRLGAFAAIGGALQSILVSQYPIYTWWRPERWFILLLSLVGLWMTVSAGYRNAVFGFALTTVTGAWCYYSWRSLLIPIFFVFAAYLLIGVQMSNMGNSFLPELPLTVQRSLSFLPGDWSKEVLDSAGSSNDFRNSIQSVYMNEYFDKSPLIGNGFIINTEELNDLTVLAKTNPTPDMYYQIKAFIVTKAFHVGWISLYDCVGIIGSIAFIALGINMIWMLGKSISSQRKRPSELFGLKVWTLCMLINTFIGFFTVYGDFKLSFPAVCAFAILLTHVEKIERDTSISDDDIWIRNA